MMSQNLNLYIKEEKLQAIDKDQARIEEMRMREFQIAKLKEENGVSVNGVKGETDWDFVFQILSERQI